MRKEGKRMRIGRAIGIVVALALLAGCGTQVPAGYSGVKYMKFGAGTEMGKIYPEGFQWHLVWNSMYIYKTRTEESKENLTVLSSDGASIQLELSILHRPVVQKLDSLQITVGPDYYNVVIAPTLRGEARQIAGNYTPEEIYSTKRDELANELLRALRAKLTNRFIEIENVIFRNVQLPKRISDAINEKLAAEQEAQRMKFILDRERQEAERKRIEAQGIADFQKIVSTGLNPMLLQWKGIEATEKLALSPNAKIVVVGN
ncbi:MAG TPA: prohibitin family protein, partial [Acidobacteriota bacterium]|nr:prohibitin family protein [Acidobacteriota bacterium]